MGNLWRLATNVSLGNPEGFNDDISWNLSAVYADCDREVNRMLWEEFQTIKNGVDGPWAVCGNFNVTRYLAERSSCQRISGAMIGISACIEELELVDPSLLRGHSLGNGGKNTAVHQI